MLCLLLLLCPLSWGRGGGGCFEQGTLIQTPGGEMPIELLRVGDEVCGGTGPARVEAIVQVEPAEYLEIQAGGRMIHVTTEHPFQIAAGVFQTAERRFAQAERIPAQLPAYNLLVSPGGTFVVSGLIVHNKGCFLPETPILKADGTRVPISQLRICDALLAFTSEGVVVHTTVRNILTHDVEEYLVVTTDRLSVRVTMEHPFYVGQGIFKTIEALRAGDTIYAFDGVGLAPQSIVSIQRIHQSTRVYNLQTDQPNTFFANGIAVHNKGGGGGGGGFGGGGGGHYGGGGYPMSDADARVFLIDCWGRYFCGDHRQPMCSSHRAAKDENLDFCYSRPSIELKAAKTRKLLEFIARVDPTFTEEGLRQLATATFNKLQECWQAREYAEMEPLLMPDLYRQHCSQLASLERNHEINLIELLRVTHVDIVNVRYPQKAGQREFTALITAVARDYYIDDRTRGFLRGDDSPVMFQEFWTFHLHEGKWLLREIEQTRESDALRTENFFEPFTDQGVERVYGETAGQSGPAGPWLEKGVETKAMRIERMLNFLVQTDKLWDRTAMVERARQIFMNVLLAREATDVNALNDADLLPGIAAALRDEITARKASGDGLNIAIFACARWNWCWCEILTIGPGTNLWPASRPMPGGLSLRAGW